MKNKFKTSRVVAYTAAGLAAVSLVSVGFSAWVISNPDTKASGNINVQVAEVSDQTLTIKLLGTEGLTADNSIKFDAAANDTSGKIKWDGKNKEDLTFEIKFSIDIADTKYFKGIQVTAVESAALLQTWVETKNWIEAPFHFDVTTPENYISVVDSTWTAAGDHYITYAKDCSVTRVDTTDDGTANAHVNVAVSDNTRTYTIGYKFKWGAAFHGVNPSLDDSTHYSTSIEALKAFAEAGTAGTNFTLSLKHDPAVTATVSK